MRSYKDWILKAEHDLKIAKDEIMEKEPESPLKRGIYKRGRLC